MESPRLRVCSNCIVSFDHLDDPFLTMGRDPLQTAVRERSTFERLMPLPRLASSSCMNDGYASLAHQERQGHSHVTQRKITK